jgi:oligo-1,6-glucosidase
MIEWWLNKGIDGFRMDVINFISKTDFLSDGKKGMYELFGDGTPYYINGPKVHDYLKEMNQRVLANYDIMTVGETPEVSPEDAVKYVSKDRHELNMIFHFELMDVDCNNSKWDYKKYQLQDIKKIIYKWYKALKEKGWNSIYLNNHDQPRVISRFGDDDKYKIESGKLLATLLLTLPGTPYIYQGEEIGMTNVRFKDITDYRDIETLNWYQEQLKSGQKEEEIMKIIFQKSRDNARTPMHWNDSPNAGFTDGEPWIKVNPNYKEINVEESLKKSDSILNYYKKLIKLRKNNLVFVYGYYQPILENDPQIFAYFRELDEDRILVILNFSGESAKFTLDTTIKEKISDNISELLISNYKVDQESSIGEMYLRPYEVRIYKYM